MFTKYILPVALLALGATIGCRHGMEHRGWGSGSYMDSELKLTSTQRTAMHDVYKRHKPTLAAKAATLMETRNLMIDKGLDPAVPNDAWRVEQDRTASAAYDLAKEVRAVYLESISVLDDAQKAKARDMFKKFKSHMQGMRHEGHHGFALHLIQNRLDLTDAQRTSIKGILERHHSQLALKHERFHTAMVSALDAALDPVTTDEVLNQHYVEVKDAGFALASEVRAAYLDIAPQLTPEQRDSFKELVSDFLNVVDSVRKLMFGF